ncbi:hypothetical protein BB561_000172 [Smittium simulii]|uniref:Uncharacterized protein n=1 Tax=Smittium simulii TaxID=133385 RepID=A0A2T9Z067_9FUNG|nr:hypothetical protein BB561_000172 [Smittium simulii]
MDVNANRNLVDLKSTSTHKYDDIFDDDNTQVGTVLNASAGSKIKNAKSADITQISEQSLDDGHKSAKIIRSNLKKAPESFDSFSNNNSQIIGSQHSRDKQASITPKLSSNRNNRFIISAKIAAAKLALAGVAAGKAVVAKKVVGGVAASKAVAAKGAVAKGVLGKSALSKLALAKTAKTKLGLASLITGSFLVNYNGNQWGMSKEVNFNFVSTLRYEPRIYFGNFFQFCYENYPQFNQNWNTNSQFRIQWDANISFRKEWVTKTISYNDINDYH